MRKKKVTQIKKMTDEDGERRCGSRSTSGAERFEDSLGVGIGQSDIRNV